MTTKRYLLLGVFLVVLSIALAVPFAWAQYAGFPGNGRGGPIASRPACTDVYRGRIWSQYGTPNDGSLSDQIQVCAYSFTNGDVWTSIPFPIGSSQSVALPVLSLYVNGQSVSTTVSTTDQLMSYTLPANTMMASAGHDDHAIRIRAFGTATDLDTKTLTLWWGTQRLVSETLGTGTTSWIFEATVLHAGSNLQNAYINQSSSTTFQAASTTHLAVTQANQIDSGTIPIFMTGISAGGSNGDLTQTGMTVELIDSVYP